MKSNIEIYYDTLSGGVEQLEFETLTFSGGEVHVKGVFSDKLQNAQKIEVIASVTNSDAFMRLALVLDALNRSGTSAFVYLVLPYIPYARQDRPCEEGEAFSLQVFARMLKTLPYDFLIVLDPHSDVALAALDDIRSKVTVIPQSYLILGLVYDRVGSGDLALVIPDAGATKKALAAAKIMNLPVIQASKVRDTKTGAIIGTSLEGPLPNCERLLVVDDICDGGRTFVELAKVIKDPAKGFKGQLLLYVTHGLFSQGFDALLEYYDTIYCHNVLTELPLPDRVVDVFDPFYLPLENSK